MAESTAFRAPDPHAGHPYAQIRWSGSKNVRGRTPATPSGISPDRTPIPPEWVGDRRGTTTAREPSTKWQEKWRASGRTDRSHRAEARSGEHARTNHSGGHRNSDQRRAKPSAFPAKTPGQANTPRPTTTPDAGTAAGTGTRPIGRPRPGQPAGEWPAAGQSGRVEPDRSGGRWGDGCYRNGGGATHGVGAVAGSWDAIMEPRAGLPLRGANVVADARRNLLRRHG
jgi:hypothetical protein